MFELSNNPRKLTDEDIEVMALRWSKDEPYPSNRNVLSFVAGMESVRDFLVKRFGEMLHDEAMYYLVEYDGKRISACRRSGVPLNESHSAEFAAAEQVGRLLLEASELIRKHNLL